VEDVGGSARVGSLLSTRVRTASGGERDYLYLSSNSSSHSTDLLFEHIFSEKNPGPHPLFSGANAV